MKLTTIKSLVAAALCAVGLSSFAAEPEAVQLWEGGPYWAECNIGATKPEDYGILTNFNDAAQAVTDALGNGWRLPTKAEFEALLANCGKGTWTEQNGAKGRLFTGTGDYSSNSIFLPAAGYVEGAGRKWAEYQGRYWSSGEVDGTLAWYLYFYDSDVRVYNYNRSLGISVRAVRDTPLVTGPTVTVDSVETGDPWSTITVNYTLDGVDAATEYKVAFDVTAGGKTAGVTNEASTLLTGVTTKEIDTAALFGAATPDTKAKVKVSLIEIKPIDYSKPVQLWANGPLFAQCNVGATEPEDYGILTNFNGAAQAVTDALGKDWRLPSDAELKILAGTNDGDKVCSNVWTTCNGVAGRRFFGMTSGYEDKSIFLPAAGYDRGYGREDTECSGRYWSSEEGDYGLGRYLYFYEGNASVYGNNRSFGMPVRAVRASGEGGSWLGPDEIVVASGEKEFALTAFRELPENPTAEDVRAAIEASGAKDKNRILALIGGASDPVAAYQEFNAWAQGVGTVAVANSDHAGDSFAFGVEELFEHEPEVQISDVAVASGAPGAMAISVTVKDGDSPKRVASEKVAQMFEATTDVADWTKGRIEATVTDRTKDLATPVEFTVTPGDGTSEKAFLRIRK